MNISSLQFDTAVNNRIFDVVLSGGFILTDRRKDLYDICAFADEISFETPEEMNEKISYFSTSENNKKYLELKNECLKLFSLEFNYEKRMSHILNELYEMDKK